MDAVSELVLSLAASAWALPVLFALCVVDSLVPPLPTESVVIALIALGATGAAPTPVAIGLTIVVAATLGDWLAYLLGRTLATRRWLRSRVVARGAARASGLLARHGSSILLVARFVPGARIAVNATAGALRVPFRRFAPLVAIAAALWAVVTVVLGVTAAAVFGEQPLLAAAVGVVAGLVLGLSLDAVLRRRRSRAKGDERRAPAA